MRSTSIFSCIITNIYFQIFIYKYQRLLHFHMVPADLLIITSFFLFEINYFDCSLKNLQNFFMQYSPLYTSCLLSMLLNEVIAGIEKPGGICSRTFVQNEFSGLFLHPSMFLIMHSRSA